MAVSRIDLLEKIPLLNRLVRSRWFQFSLILVNLAFFYLFIISGLFGSPVGNRNIIVVFIWIFWWFLLIVLMVPFGARIWCTVCPLPAVGEWMQRGRLVGVRSGNDHGTRNRFFGRKLRWPRKLSNIWPQNIGFLFLATFSALLVTRPIASVIVLGGLILVAAVIFLLYRGRAFCKYLCPIGGFMSLYSMTSTVAIRSRDLEICGDCREKSCIRGSEDGWACAWGEYIGKLDRNNYCGMCFECVKSCPNDNIGLFVRGFAQDTEIKGYDEAWKAFIMLVLAGFYSVTLLGPWGVVKNWANVTESGNLAGFGIYALAMWGSALVIFPLMYAGVIAVVKRIAGPDGPRFKDLFVGLSYPLVPLGLLVWIAFTVPLLMVNGSYILSVASDPLGWGWNLLGTAGLHWTPVLPHWVPAIQVFVLLTGLWFALRRGIAITRELIPDPRRAMLGVMPLAAFLVLITSGFLYLYVG